MRKKSPEGRLQQHKERIFALKNHPFIIPVITLLVLVFVTLIALVNFSGTTVGPADSRVVHVYVDGVERTLPTRAPTVEDLLKRLDIKLGEGDVVEPKKSTQILEDGFNVNIYRARPVTVIDGKKRITRMSAQQSPESIAKEVGIKLFPEDDVQVSVPENVLKEGIGEKYVIQHAVPMKLVLYGQSYEIRTHAQTVAELLKEKNINEDEVTVFPDKDQAIKKGSVIFVTYQGKQIKSIAKTIHHKTKTIEDPDMPAGATEVREKGRDGKKVVLYEVDPDTHQKKVLKEVIAYAPVDRVVVKGTRTTVVGDKADWMRAAGINSSQYGAADFVISRESGWNPGSVSANRCIGLGQNCPSGGGYGLTSSCPGWQNDPVCQLKYFTNYANGRYGSWQGAQSFWLSNHWW